METSAVLEVFHHVFMGPITVAHVFNSLTQSFLSSVSISYLQAYIFTSIVLIVCQFVYVVYIASQ